jgi:hypothetical protein
MRWWRYEICRRQHVCVVRWPDENQSLSTIKYQKEQVKTWPARYVWASSALVHPQNIASFFVGDVLGGDGGVGLFRSKRISLKELKVKE